ncbi:MAG: monovalent cation/H(+) antiporter subunit G [Dehalococcoidia bacterium]
MSELVGSLVALVGAVFLLLASLALLRMPDLYGRLSATSKAVTLGASLILAGAAIATWEAGVAARAMAGIAFLFLTSPIAGHVVARAGWRTGVEAVVSVRDEFETDPGIERVTPPATDAQTETRPEGPR